MATPLDTRIPPPAWTLGLGVVQWLLAGRPDYRRRPGPARFLVAGTVGTASAVLGIAAVSEFIRRGTTVHPGTPEHASTLVTERVYRFTRNPMYLSLTGALVTNAAWLGSVRAVAPVAALAGILTAVQILPEERALQDLFGETYEDYRRRVPRWLGVPGHGGRRDPEPGHHGRAGHGSDSDAGREHDRRPGSRAERSRRDAAGHEPSGRAEHEPSGGVP
ncbi:isoprenylcysteine carboxylmethyltransferase family protein [Raineyella sp.]|uniref:methyltransferase family protein n=1 Tax=Raineyella sp. TaxID=1911550 RepID=UPI002B21DCFB|nr:isoprenylcysteine carboxylmethyltransferase family protein [Raineyella sp.]MEA5153994.1 isoprenylcysteine carboxylmethyltransferase family protein [Raineyella sp.]